MAQRLAFHYLPGNSVLHRWDARCKFLGLLISTFGLLHMDTRALAFFSVLFAATPILVRLPWIALFRDLKAWGLLLLIIFVFKALFDPEPNPPLFTWLPATRESIQAASLTCWRLGLILAYAVLFSLVTRHRELQDALIWFMQPFRFLPARRIALMVALTIRFLPLIMDQAEEVSMAIKARSGSRRKNPLLRAKFYLLPVLRRSLARADDLALALAARGYREDLPILLPKVPAGHAAALVCLFFLVLAANQIGL